jgi:hypothetical protein
VKFLHALVLVTRFHGFHLQILPWQLALVFSI